MKRNVLLAVIGLSPQVITETLFALNQQSRPVDCIHVITTRQGREKIHAELLASGTGHFYRYLRDHGDPDRRIEFHEGHVHVVRDPNGREIDDINTEEHNEACLELCLRLTYQLTASDDTAVFFSVSGGRKTMSSCLTLAAQMYGRPQDRIYHVLVSPEFEMNRDFYFPPRVSEPVCLRDEQGQPYWKESRYARLALVHMPFASIRRKLSDAFLKEPLDPGSLMASLIREDQALLEMDLLESKLRYKGMEVDMMPARMALYGLFIMMKKECSERRKTCSYCTECYLDMEAIYTRQSRIVELYRVISGRSDLDEMSDTGILGLTAENFRSYKGKIRRDLETGFGRYSLEELEIASIGSRPNTKYGLRIDKRKIKIIM